MGKGGKVQLPSSQQLSSHHNTFSVFKSLRQKTREERHASIEEKLEFSTVIHQGKVSELLSARQCSLTYYVF